MQINVYSILFICGTAFTFILNHILEFIDYRARVKRGTIVPEMLQEHVTPEEMELTVDYENDKYFFWIKRSIVSVLINLVTVVFFYGFFYKFCVDVTSNAYFCVYFFTLMIALPEWLIDIPFDAYKEFHIEKKYGFSKTTKSIWFDDLGKQTILNVTLTSLLLLGAIALFKNYHNYWYILLGAGYLFVSLGISFIYPIWIAPMFNKFVPLEDGSLKTRLEALLDRCGFKSSGVYIMDASKRSGHSNAYFTGFGKSKRIVLYDTLLEQLTDEEIESVLAHELGHYKKHHVIKRLIIMIPLVFAALWLMNQFILDPKLYSAFGVAAPSLRVVIADSVSINIYAFTKYCGVVFLMAVFGGFVPFASLISNFFSRKDEFEADRYAKELCGTGEHLCTALIKLNKENLMEFTPPKIYSIFNYNHPPLLERMNHLQ